MASKSETAHTGPSFLILNEQYSCSRAVHWRKLVESCHDCLCGYQGSFLSNHQVHCWINELQTHFKNSVLPLCNSSCVSLHNVSDVVRLWCQVNIQTEQENQNKPLSIEPLIARWLVLPRNICERITIFSAFSLPFYKLLRMLSW